MGLGDVGNGLALILCSVLDAVAAGQHGGITRIYFS